MCSVEHVVDSFAIGTLPHENISIIKRYYRSLHETRNEIEKYNVV